MRRKLVGSITVASVLAGFMLFGWGSPSLVTELKEENQALEAKVEALEEKVESAKKIMEGLSKAVSELNDDLYKVCQAERKMVRPLFSLVGYKELHSLVTEIMKKRGYEIRGQGQQD